MGPIGEYFPDIEQLRQVAAREIESPKADPAGIEAFSAVLEGAFAGANRAALEAQSAASAFANGSRDDIHGTMLALSKADIELRFLGTARNKVIDAFYELWRMQI